MLAICVIVGITYQGFGQASVVAAEYFFDTDPGVGNGSALSIGTPGSTVSFMASIPTNSLPQGFHTLKIRAQDSNGKWGLFESHVFYIGQVSTSTVVVAEYFFDTDPGVGNGSALSIGTPGSTVSFMASIPTNSLPPGFHTLKIRTQDSNGKWGLFESHTFFIGQVSTSTVVAAEYFFDTDPGVGNGSSLTIGTPGSTVSFMASIPTNSLPQGFHTLKIRTQDSNGKWGLFESHTFFIGQESTSIVVAAEVFAGNDPGVGNGYPIAFTTPGTTVTEVIEARLSPCLPEGTNKYKIRVKDDHGVYGIYDLGDITIDNSLLPEALITASTQISPICEGGVLSLNSDGFAIDLATSYAWSGPNGFTSTDADPVISALTSAHSGTYALTITYNAGCTLSTSVDVTVNQVPTTTISATPNPICEDSDLTLNATGGSNYSWAGPNGFLSTDQSPTISDISPADAGTYSVTVTNVAGCIRPASISVIVHPNPIPIITATPNPVCLLDDIQLSVTGTGTFQWTGPNGFTSSQQSITLPIIGTNQAGNYIVTVTTAEGCTRTANSTVNIINCMDLLVDAVNVTVGDLCVSNSSTMELAGNEIGEPIPPCGADNQNFATIWFKFTPPASGSVRIKSQSDQGGLEGTKIGIYELNGTPAFENLQLFACEDALTLPKLSEVYLTGLNPALTYYIQVGTDNPNLINGNTFCISIEEITSAMLSGTGCASTNPTVSSKNSNQTFWLSLLDDDGKLIANVQHNGNTAVGSYTAKQYINTGSVRQDEHGIFFLDRNWTLDSDVDPGQIIVSTFLTQDELEDLTLADPSVDDISDLMITHDPAQGCLTAPTGSDNVLLDPTSVNLNNAYSLTFTTSGFSTFFAHGGTVPLPLYLVHFTARKEDRFNLVQWETRMEEGMEKFVLERKTEPSESWQQLTTVAAKNKTSNRYSYTDASPNILSYYRLQSVSLDGHIEYSNIVSVLRENAADYSVYPTLVKDLFQIKGEKPNSKATLKLTNILSKPIWNKMVSIDKNETYSVDISRYPPGIYYLTIEESGQEVKTFKVIKIE